MVVEAVPDTPAATTLIRDLPSAERPRERLRDAGPRALSNAELLAILLRTGSSRESALSQATRLLVAYGGLAGLRNAPFAQLCNERGFGEAKASQVLAALELGVRLASTAPDERPVLGSADDVANLLLAEMSLLEQERVRVVLLDARNRLMGIHEMYQGSAHTAQVRIGELLRDAVRTNATSMVLVHNHPSGDPTPSMADVHMTKSLIDAAKLMDIALHDHVVIAGGRYASMKQLHMAFPADAN